MLDYNHTPKFADVLNAVIDAALTAENAAQPPRDYLGGSRIGHPCERALQFEFADRRSPFTQSRESPKCLHIHQPIVVILKFDWGGPRLVPWRSLKLGVITRRHSQGSLGEASCHNSTLNKSKSSRAPSKRS